MLKWFWPALVATLSLSAMTIWFQHKAIEFDLETKAQAILLTDNDWADVSLDGRDLSMFGIAPTKERQEKAKLLAQEVYGVRIVIDKSTLLPVESPFATSLSFDSNGLRLTGFLSNEQARSEIQSLFAARLPGIVINDDVTLARGAPKQLLHAISESLELVKTLSSWTIDIVDKNVRVQGYAKSSQNYVQWANNENSQFSNDYKLLSADVRPPVLQTKPSLILSIEQNVISMKGLMPNTILAQKLTDAIGRRFPDSQLENEFQFASGMRENYAQVSEFMFNSLTELGQGAVSLDGSRISIKGRLRVGLNLNDVVGQFEGSVPEGISLSTDELSESNQSKWQIIRNENGIRISGAIADEALRLAILQQAQNSFGSSNVMDEQEIDPAGMANNLPNVVPLIVDMMSRMSTGSAVVFADSLDLSGKILLDKSMNAVNNSVQQLLASGINVKSELEVASPPEATSVLHLDSAACLAHLVGLLSNNTILFESGNSNLRSDSYGFLDEIAYSIRRCVNTKLVVVGHTDSDGDAAANQNLSLDRASEVIIALKSRGVDVTRLSVLGYGETRPIADNSTEAGKIRNRRIEFMLDNNL